MDLCKHCLKWLIGYWHYGFTLTMAQFFVATNVAQMLILSQRQFIWMCRLFCAVLNGLIFHVHRYRHWHKMSLGSHHLIQEMSKVCDTSSLFAASTPVVISKSINEIPRGWILSRNMSILYNPQRKFPDYASGANAFLTNRSKPNVKPASHRCGWWQKSMKFGGHRCETTPQFVKHLAYSWYVSCCSTHLHVLISPPFKTIYWMWLL